MVYGVYADVNRAPVSSLQSPFQLIHRTHGKHWRLVTSWHLTSHSLSSVSKVNPWTLSPILRTRKDLEYRVSAYEVGGGAILLLKWVRKCDWLTGSWNSAIRTWLWRCFRPVPAPCRGVFSALSFVGLYFWFFCHACMYVTIFYILYFIFSREFLPVRQSWSPRFQVFHYCLTTVD